MKIYMAKIETIRADTSVGKTITTPTKKKQKQKLKKLKQCPIGGWYTVT